MSKQLSSLAIVILNYNGMRNQYLERFIPSVCKYSTYPNTRIYVADNKSTDESVDYLLSNGFELFIDKQQALKSDSQRFLLKMNENYGFAQGYNIALRRVEADYYVLLNSDIEVGENWTEPIVELMERDPQIAACQPKVRMFDQKELFEYAGAAGGWMDKWGYPFCRGRIFGKLEEDKGQYDDVSEIFWATGAALFIRSELYYQLDGFDNFYFAHMEEIDLCWRLKRAGYKIMCCPKSVVWHVGGGTLATGHPRKTYLNFRNSLLTILKNDEHPFQVIAIRFLLDAVVGTRFLLSGKLKHTWAIVKAHWSFFRYLNRYRQKRKILKKTIKFCQYPNTKANYFGYYTRSIIWQYFVKRRKTFDRLPKK